MHAEAAEDPHTLRISMDAKATVNLGPFSRGGKRRISTEAADHDFQPEERMTPVGMLMTETDALFVYGITSNVTSDCLVDRLQPWWNEVGSRFALTTTLLINLDNGPECHRRRSQFMLRMVHVVRDTGVTVKLAYYPPYHSKYNPIERCWGVLEQLWNGSLLDGLQVALDCIETMTWRGVHPIANALTTIYRTGVTLRTCAMDALESCFIRDLQLGTWFVTISPDTINSIG